MSPDIRQKSTNSCVLFTPKADEGQEAWRPLTRVVTDLLADVVDAGQQVTVVPDGAPPSVAVAPSFHDGGHQLPCWPPHYLIRGSKVQTWALFVLVASSQASLAPVCRLPPAHIHLFFQTPASRLQARRRSNSVPMVPFLPPREASAGLATHPWCTGDLSLCGQIPKTI